MKKYDARVVRGWLRDALARGVEAPCPFCGEASRLPIHEHGEGRAYIQCLNCGAMSPDGVLGEALVKWNNLSALAWGVRDAN